MTYESVPNPRGTAIEIDGQPMYFAPLSLGALETHQADIESFGTAGVKFGVVIDMAHKSLKRNYPDITREQVGDLIDVQNMQEVMTCIVSAAGLTKKAGDGAAEAGN